ncbi:MAG: DUF523 and DUF1722 domain-containing protein [Aquificaceae bacterium]|nr:DUF523 and DUF1722 domain-containing protein [Aquificaceae bacterium]
MRNFPKPRIVVSACLNLKPVRYNGQEVRDEFVLKLLPYCEVLEVCPEVAIGLGVPRERVIVYRRENSFGLSQPSTGLELTEKMESFAETFLKTLQGVDAFLLKSKSPSCGVSNTKVYRDPEGREFHSKGRGLFALKVLDRFEYLPVEDEGRLKDKEIREHFLTRLFSVAELRENKERINRISELMDFHQRNKYLLMAHSQRKLKEMGRLVASAKEENLKETLSLYGSLFLQAIRKKPSRGQQVNTLLHIFGHISRNLKEREKAHFFKLVEDYKRGRLDKRLPLEFLKAYAYRFENNYLMAQTYLEPYPEELMV